MRIKDFFAVSVLATAGFGSAAQASVMYTNSIISQDASNYADAGLSVTLPQFDTSLGSLMGIIITVTTSAIADISITNFSQTASYLVKNATALTKLDVSGPLGYSTSVTTTSTLATGTAVSGSAGFPGVSDFSGIAGGSSSRVIVPTIDFSSYEGIGSLSLTFINLAGSAAFGGTAVGAPRNTVYFGGGDNLAVNVLIDYETVPEPASMAVLGTALIGAGAARRRRRF